MLTNTWLRQENCKPDFRRTQGEMNSKEDAALFRSSIGPVTPLAEQNRSAPPRPSTQARVRSGVSKPHIPDSLSDYLHDQVPEDYLSNGLSHLTLRKLRRSKVQDSLDLHGSPVDAARVLLQEFLFWAVQSRMRCVMVIHGKGVNSPGGIAVLRTLTRNWLRQHPQVLAYCAATPAMGGSGAVLILLKS